MSVYDEEFGCVVEIHWPECQQNFSVTCAGTGEQCYNTWATCKSKCDFVCGSRSVYYSNCMLPASSGIDAYPIITSYNPTGSKIDFDKSLSNRAFIQITMNDFKDNDATEDPYYPRADSVTCAEDSYGTYWGKRIARQCWLDGLKATVHTGPCSVKFSDWDRQTYFVSSIQPNITEKSGSVSINLQDALYFVDGAKFPCYDKPVASAINQGTEQRITLTTGSDIPGSGDDEDPASIIGSQILSTNYLEGYSDEQDKLFIDTSLVLIDSEYFMVKWVESDAVPSGYNWVVLERGLCGTEIKSHSAGTQVKPCVWFRNTHIVDVIEKILTDCSNPEELARVCCDDETLSCLIDSGVDGSFEEYRCNNPTHIVSDAPICNEEDKSKLLTELQSSYGFALYFDHKEQKIKIIDDAPPINPNAPLLNEYEIQNWSRKEKHKPVSQVLIQAGLIDWSKGLTSSNLSINDLILSRDSLLADCDKKESKKPNLHIVKTRFITLDNYYIGQARADRIFCQRRKSTYEISGSIMADLVEVLGFEQGSWFRLSHASFQLPSGKPDEDTYWMMLQLYKNKDRYNFCAINTIYDETSSPSLSCGDMPTLISGTIEDCEDLDCDHGVH